MIAFLLILGLLGLAAAATSAPPTASDKLLSGVRTLTDYDLSGIAVEKSTVGVAFFVIGVYLALFGKRHFKLFLGLIGFIAFSLVSLSLLLILDGNFDMGENRRTIFWVVIGICGALGAAISVVAWRIGVYAAAAVGGFFMGTFFMTAFASLTSHVSRQVFQVLCAISAVLLVSFFDELVIKAASAMTGSILTVCGLDCFLETGFNETILNVLYNHNLESVGPGIYGMLAVTAAATVGGFAYQCLCGGRGFGNKN